jgi:hypothetical protein
MNEKEMVAHIKALTRVIERQAEYAEQVNRSALSISRQIANIMSRLTKLEGYKSNYDE